MNGDRECRRRKCCRHSPPGPRRPHGWEAGMDDEPPRLDMPVWVDANRWYGRTFVRYLFRNLAERHALKGYEPR